jgi:two-component system sensor histidine kinase VicK
MSIIGIPGTSQTASPAPPSDALPFPRHSVQFYTEDSFLLDGLDRFIGAAIAAGDAAVVIATKEHRERLARRLKERGLDLTLVAKEGRYLSLDAANALAQLTVNGWPNAALFSRVMGDIIRRLALAAGGDHRIVAFGEMVALLWAEGKPDAAIRLEQLWNELGQTHSFHLLCAYPLNFFKDEEPLRKICAEHSQFIPAETCTNLVSGEERLRNVVFLQQKAQALEREILECKKAQQALQSREADLKDFIENAVIPMHWVAADGTILWANRAEMNLLGYSREEYVGHHISEFHDDKAVIADMLERLGRHEELHGSEARLRCKDGSIRHVRVHSNAFVQDGKFVHTRCFNTDVTDQKKAEEARLDSQERLRLANQVALIGTFDWNVRTGENRWTPELEALYGLPPGGFARTQAAFEEMIHAEDRAEVKRQVKLSLQSGAPMGWEWRVIWPDGSVRWLAGRWQAFRDEYGKPWHVTGANIDITERKQADEALRRLAAIVDSSDDAVASKDLNGVVTSWNAAAERMFGYKAEEIVGRPITLIIPPELQDDERRILAKIVTGERLEHFETVRLTKSGERIDVSLTVSPVKDQRGKIVGAAKIVRDITQQKKMERALHTTERLASVGRLAATVAHEINNPLEAVTNFIYLAKLDPALPENVKDYLTRADDELGRVAHLVQQTLGFYRDNSAAVQLAVADVIQDVLIIYERKFKYKELNIEKRLEPGLTTTTLLGELKQILSNLVANAIDASKDGGKIVIGAKASRHFRTGQPGIRITVADNGIGMSCEHKKKLFLPFFTTKREVGTGLGLWITKDLLEKKGGHIRFRSSDQEKSGTVMSIFLPLESPAGAAGASSPVTQWS